MPVFGSLLAGSGALRIASLNLCTDEYLLLLARPDEIASVSRLAKDSADSSLWKRAAPYLSNRGTIESALGSRPTLLMTMGGGGRSTALIASKMGIPTIDLAYPASIAEVERNMVRVARALGDERRAIPWRKRLRQLQRNVPRPVDAIFLGSGGNSFAANSLGAQWMRLAGLEQRALPGGRATLEMLTVAPPALLLRSTYRMRERSLGQAWLEHPLASPARSKIVPTDGRAWTCSGPLMVGEIEQLRRTR